jgi:hypothetical protein
VAVVVAQNKQEQQLRFSGMAEPEEVSGLKLSTLPFLVVAAHR